MLSIATSPKTRIRAQTASLALHAAAVMALTAFDFGAGARPPRFDSTIVAIVPRPTLTEPDLSLLRRDAPQPPRMITRNTQPAPLRADPVMPLQAAAPPKPAGQRLAAAPAIDLEIEAPRLETSMPDVPSPPTPPRIFDAEPSTRSSSAATVRAAGFQLATLRAGSPKAPLPIATAGFSPGQAELSGSASASRTAAADFAGATSAAAAGSTRRTSASGFGAASTSEQPAPPTPSERPVGFGGVVARRAAKHTAEPASPLSAEQPPKILAKPRPLYTDAARAQGVEGDALLEVLLGKSGEARVLRVIKGLGYGLDERAVEAAHLVRFEPALRDGRPVDAIVTMRIRFQLAL